jgi:hypothetical protein
MLAKEVERAWGIADRISSLSCESYLDQVVVDCRPEPKRFALVREPWQERLLGKIVPALESVAGVRNNYKGPRGFWLTLPRGHDKTSSIGRLCNWVLSYTRRYVSAIAAAADREQASLLAEFMQGEANLNPWFSRHLKFKNYRVDGAKHSNLKIISADAFSSYGLRTDLIVCDELTHWPSEELWSTLMSGSEKRPGSVFIVITNAGTINSWQWRMLEAAKNDPDYWYVFEAPGQLASWMSRERVNKLRAMLPPAVARRVFDNQWIDPSEDCGYVSRQQAAECERLGERLGLQEVLYGHPDRRYVASIDYGPVKDRTVCCVGHWDQELKSVVVDRMDVWEGRKEPTGRVPVAKVEYWLEQTLKNFNHPTVVIDPYQMESTFQRYEGSFDVRRFQPRGGKANYEMGQCLRDLIVNNRIIWHPGCGTVILPDGNPSTLVDELSSLVIRQMSYGYRFDHTAGQHDDRAVAIGMMALTAVEDSGRKNYDHLLRGNIWF